MVQVRARGHLVILPAIRSALQLLVFVALAASSGAFTGGLDAYIEEQMHEGGIPGASIAVLKNDAILWHGAYGTTKPGDPSAPSVTNETAFMFASLSKTNIAVAAMLLYEKGWLAPREDVNTYLNFTVRNPQHPGATITLHSLLTHTSSISDAAYYDIPIYMAGDPTISLHDFLYGYLAKDGRWASKGASYSRKDGPGQKFDYSNVGACLMAYICELVAVKNGLATSFNDLVRRHIYAPLGAGPADGGYFAKDFPTLKPPAYALPSQLNRGTWHNCGLYSVPDFPSCDWRSSALTYAKLLGMYINFGSFQGMRLLKRETVEYMRTRSGFQTQGEEPSNALFLFERHLLDNYTWVLGHDGSDEGVSTYAYFNPSTGVGYVLLTNGDLDQSSGLGEAAMNIGSKLMEVFDVSRGSSGHAGLGRQPGPHRKDARRPSAQRGLRGLVGGFPGSEHAPGCEDLGAVAAGLVAGDEAGGGLLSV